MSYIIEHTRIGFCGWDVLALVVLVIVTIVFAVRCNKLKEEQEELEECLSELYAEDSIEAEIGHEI